MLALTKTAQSGATRGCVGEAEYRQRCELALGHGALARDQVGQRARILKSHTELLHRVHSLQQRDAQRTSGARVHGAWIVLCVHACALRVCKRWCRSNMPAKAN